MLGAGKARVNRIEIVGVVEVVRVVADGALASG